MKQKVLLKRGGMRLLSRLSALLAACLIVIQVNAQDIMVRGTVVASDEQPLPDVSVKVKGGTGAIATTNQNGSFTAKVSKSDILQLSKTGYAESDIKPTQYSKDGVAEIRVVLFNIIEQRAKEDKIATLYGNQSKELVTGAYSQMNFSDVIDNPIVNNVHKMTGHLSGLSVFQSNGEPGVESHRLMVRGQRSLRSNSPVILVDGYERDMSLLDPNEIETVTVMKDATATAQYGLRSGNGIIAVTTKRGQTGKIKVSLSASGGLKQDITRPKFLNSYDYARLYNEAMYNDYNDGSRSAAELAAFAPAYSTAMLEKYRQTAAGNYTGELDPYLYPDINWYDRFVKKNTWQQRYNITANGGTSYAKYFVSLGYLKNDGIFNTDKKANTYKTNSDMNMVTLRSNLDIQATKKLLVSVNISARQEQRTMPGDASNFASRLFQAMFRTPPNAFPIHNPDGSLGGTKDYTNNPYGLLHNQGYSLGYTRNLDADIKLRHKLDFITQGLNVEAAFAFDSWFEQQTKRNKTFAVYNIATTAEPDGTLSPVYKNGELQYVKTGSDTQMGDGGSYPGSMRTIAWRFMFDYNRTFGQHTLGGVLGYNQRQIGQEDNSNLQRQYLNLNTRLTYSFDNRYVVEFAAGYEGSEQFPSGNRFGFFPSASAGWIISNEKFIPKNNFLSFLKLRGSYGLTANDDIGGYFAFLHRFTKGGNTQFGKNLPVGTSVNFSTWDESAPAQKNVTWEKVKKANIGIDARFFDNKLDISADIFTEKNRDIMVEPSISYIIGTKVALAPLGKMDNKGLDLYASYANSLGKVQYSITGTYMTFAETIIDNAEKTPIWPYQTRLGRPRDQAWGFEAIGYFTQADIDNPNTPSQSQYGNVRPGDIMYKDRNGDRVIDEYDQVYLGRQVNNNQASAQIALAWKGFDFSIRMVGQWGGSMSLNGEAAYEFYQNGGVMNHHLNRYNPQDPASYVSQGMKFYKGDYPRLSLSNTTNNRQGSSFWRVPTDLLRLKTIELGYTFKSSQLNRLRLENLRLYVSGYNICTWSATNIVDVEANSGSGMIYPVQKIWSFGARVTF